jgi:peptidoglycan/xylan/chitin deacetylase (PgdA/CDA1 family)
MTASQSKMNLRSHLGTVRRKVLCLLHRRSVPLGTIGPIVSFTFDDFPRTAYSVGGAILEKFGARGTYYVAPGLMNTSDELGEQCHVDDLHSLLEKGHELGSQTFRHSSSRAVSLAAFRADVEKGREALKELTGIDPPNFAYPYGHATLKSKKTLGPTLASSRSIFPGCNGPDLDLNLLKANRLYGDADQSSAVAELIRQNVARKSWLIFYTHDVRPSPSIYGCTPAVFESAVSLTVRSGSRILTVQDVLTELGVQNGHPKGQVPCGVSL